MTLKTRKTAKKKTSKTITRTKKRLNPDSVELRFSLSLESTAESLRKKYDDLFINKYSRLPSKQEKQLRTIIKDLYSLAEEIAPRKRIEPDSEEEWRK